MSVIEFQIGKQGLNENFMQVLKGAFERNDLVRISVLKSARPEGKKQVIKYSEEILEELGTKYTARVIGFTIVLKRWRKDMR